MQIYVVKSGDTLWQIAQRHGADFNQVVLANQMAEPGALVVGQALVIPQPAFEYVFQSGDSLARIASNYGVSLRALMEANNITDPNLVFTGEMLKIPSVTHTVQSGETLGEIARRYHVSVERIAQVNGIQPNAELAIGQRLRIPVLERPVKEINAYTTQINEQGAQEVTRHGRNFTYLSPFMHAVNEDGTFTPMQDQALLEAARSTGTAPLFVITNFKNRKFDSDLAAAILRNPDIQETLFTNLIAEMKQKGYRGLNIDFEYVYPQDRENYNSFLRRVVARMHPEGFSVSTAVAPKERADQPGLLYEAHDYKAHGEIVDFVIPMTYEWGWAGGRPWAISPINKMRDVLNYAVTAIPRNKIITGLSLYGRDWKIPWQEGTIARTISPEEGVQLARRYNEAIEYNETYQAPHFRYTDETGQRHEVWFEDARSMQAKYDLIKEYGLRGGSYWVLGNPFPQNWPVLQNNFKVRKI
ncbi:LysM peptidoglycan-binding domain-containing protein [Virgibacillus sp. 179-BFC.A HS]|uniref:LysM peptidoglycan-binding domain-containing protein n=1 Tax=Tigheibacillus jepli TaxID=3035914 RepID=A0ABU5CL34_9BACI|nr:LysM peptidoglycan-binding domain-containing protein [Virgibacillus sp. 179-BFC.A HS]MDY0407034.1 LysM peptidoglycan-binding domain-containing protein [Virgibacillus sp. 179-BFC.A HS]